MVAKLTCARRTRKIVKENGAQTLLCKENKKNMCGLSYLLNVPVEAILALLYWIFVVNEISSLFVSHIGMHIGLNVTVRQISISKYTTNKREL